MVRVSNTSYAAPNMMVHHRMDIFHCSRLGVNNGRVHYERLFSIDLYWYDLCKKLRNAECMIHLEIPYAYNHFEWLLMVYTMIISLRQAFQSLTPNRSFIYLQCWNLENINVLKTLACFGVQKGTGSFGVIVGNDTLRSETW